jgi:hypothetical protein
LIAPAAKGRGTIRGELAVRIAFIVVAVALASGAAADPQPTASETFALRTECMNLGEAWDKKHPFTREGTLRSLTTFYVPKINRCLILTKYWDSKNMFEVIADIHTGFVVAKCGMVNGEVAEHFETGCAYIEKIINDDLASGFNR